ncbi:YezD family protein [Gorillibacterium sp. sgz5001074]|uniref:YezD family protein n=1 Tax=Gorillibacterium sp. sgz5001074 TaxID=3446695 RepID=UPI003F6810F1
MAKPLHVDELWLERIAQSLEGISFGTVQIVVHEGKIVQLEKTERYRFENEAKQQGAAAPKRQLNRAL